MTCDYHMHSRFSGDSQSDPEENVLAAVRCSLKHICFTEHLDPDYPYGDVCFDLDTDAYFEEIGRLREKYKDVIDIRTGVELGLQPHLKEYLGEWLSGRDFDFVIGSTHLVDRMDPYYPEFWKGRNAGDSIRRYLEATYENITAFDGFDVYGHLDYIIRYVPGGTGVFDYDKYSGETDAVLKLLIKKGKGIEINTGGYKAGLPDPNPNAAVLKRYRELGGTIVTMGSDAHAPEFVGYRFSDAAEILKKCGFDRLTYFIKRKPCFLPL